MKDNEKLNKGKGALLFSVLMLSVLCVVAVLFCLIKASDEAISDERGDAASMYIDQCTDEYLQSHLDVNTFATDGKTTEATITVMENNEYSNEQNSNKTTERYSAEKTTEIPTTEYSIIENNISDYVEASYDVEISDTTYATTQAHNTAYATTQESSEHIHNFVVDVTYIMHSEEGHYEEVCISPGYEEDIYESYDCYCYQCGAVMDEFSLEELLDHSALHGAFGTYTKIVDTIWHEPIYTNQYVVDKEAYKEEVKVERCIECGYVK